MADYDTPPSDSAETTSIFSGAGNGILGVFNSLANGYGKALGERKGSFGQPTAAGVVNPSTQYQRNPLTGQLYNTSTGQAVAGSSGGFSLTSPVVLIGLAGVAVVALLLLRR